MFDKRGAKYQRGTMFVGGGERAITVIRPGVRFARPTCWRGHAGVQAEIAVVGWALEGWWLGVWQLDRRQFL